MRLWRQQCQPLRILSRNEHQFPKKCHPSKNHLSSVLGLGDRLHYGVRKGVVGLHSLCKTDRACIRLHKQILHQQVEQSPHNRDLLLRIQIIGILGTQEKAHLKCSGLHPKSPSPIRRTNWGSPHLHPSLCRLLHLNAAHCENTRGQVGLDRR